MLEKVLIGKFGQWLVDELPNVCDSDHATMAQYIQTLVLKQMPDDELKQLCITRLEEFLADKTVPFVESMFAWITAARESLKAAVASVDTADRPGVKRSAQSTPQAAVADDASTKKVKMTEPSTDSSGGEQRKRLVIVKPTAKADSQSDAPPSDSLDETSADSYPPGSGRDVTPSDPGLTYDGYAVGAGRPTLRYAPQPGMPYLPPGAPAIVVRPADGTAGQPWLSGSVITQAPFVYQTAPGLVPVQLAPQAAADATGGHGGGVYVQTDYDNYRGGGRGGGRGGRGRGAGRGGHSGGRAPALKAQFNRETGKMMAGIPPKPTEGGESTDQQDDAEGQEEKSKGADEELDIEGSPENVHLYVCNIPQHLRDMGLITGHFAKFQGLQQVRMLNEGRAAKVSFATHEQAKTALSDPGAVCNWPFIIVRWADIKHKDHDKHEKGYAHGYPSQFGMYGYPPFDPYYGTGLVRRGGLSSGRGRGRGAAAAGQDETTHDSVAAEKDVSQVKPAQEGERKAGPPPTAAAAAAIADSTKKLIEAKMTLAKTMFAKVDEATKQAQDTNLSEADRKAAAERATALKKQIAVLMKEIEAAKKELQSKS